MNSFRRCQYGYKIFGQFNPCFVKIGFGCVVATGDKLGRAICQECKRKVSASDHGRTTSWSKPCGGFLIPMATATLSPISTNCAKRPHDTKTFSPLAELLPNRTLPELLFLET